MVYKIEMYQNYIFIRRFFNHFILAKPCFSSQLRFLLLFLIFIVIVLEYLLCLSKFAHEDLLCLFLDLDLSCSDLFTIIFAMFLNIFKCVFSLILLKSIFRFTLELEEVPRYDESKIKDIGSRR